MNTNTKHALIGFIDSIENLAFSVSSISGTNAYEYVMVKASELKKRIEQDETLFEVP